MQTSNYEAICNLVKSILGITNFNMEYPINEGKNNSEDITSFIEAFKDKFNVDMVGFSYFKFFYEDQFIMLNLVRYFLIKTGFFKGKKKKLTIGHLVKVADKQVWFDPE